MNAGVLDVEGEIFRTRSALSGQRLNVKLTGCLDMETAPALERFLGAISDAVASDAVREIQFDTEGLYLMSSSSISHVATWVKRLKGKAGHCRVKFKTNPNLAWQRRTLDSIRRVAEGIVSVE